MISIQIENGLYHPLFKGYSLIEENNKVYYSPTFPRKKPRKIKIIDGKLTFTKISIKKGIPHFSGNIRFFDFEDLDLYRLSNLLLQKGLTRHGQRAKQIIREYLYLKCKEGKK